MWRDNEYVIPMRRFSHFIAAPSQIVVDMAIKVYRENDARKLFELKGNPDNDLSTDLDTQNPGLKAIFFEAPKLNYKLYHASTKSL